MSKPDIVTDGSAKIHVVACKLCGESASGPDIKAVEAAMDRHAVKKHPKVVKK